LGYHNKGDKVMIYAQLPEAGAAILKRAAEAAKGHKSQVKRQEIFRMAELAVMKAYPEYFQAAAIEYAMVREAYL
jgi:hypothetical protein